MTSDESANFMRKALSYLHRAEASLASMNLVEPSDDSEQKEKHFADLLNYVNVACEALLSASLGIDNGVSRNKLIQKRKTDPMLFWYWKARDVETHHLLAKKLDFWSGDFKVIDSTAHAAACRKLGIPVDGQSPFKIAFGTINLKRAMRCAAANIPIDKDALSDAGLEPLKSGLSISLTVLRYLDQHKKLVCVAKPRTLEGKFYPAAADITAEAVIKFYSDWYYKLLALGLSLGVIAPNDQLP